MIKKSLFLFLSLFLVWIVADVFVDYPDIRTLHHKIILDCETDFYTYTYPGWSKESRVFPSPYDDLAQEQSADARLGKCLCEHYLRQPTPIIKTELEILIQKFPPSQYYKSTNDLDSICKYKDDYFLFVLE